MTSRRNHIRSGNRRGYGIGECWREEWSGRRGRWETNLGGGKGGGDGHEEMVEGKGRIGGN